MVEVNSYTLCKVMAEGIPPFYCDGIKISDDTEIEREFHGASHELFAYTYKKRNIDFELIEPRDHAALNDIARKCREEKFVFTIVAMSETETGDFVPMERLEGCVIPGRDRTLGNHDTPKLAIKGYAARTMPIRSARE